MIPIFYITNQRPVSVNNSDKHMDFENTIRTDFEEHFYKFYSDLPLDSWDLKTRITFICADKYRDQIPDIDNISKPIIDAFQGIIYINDKQVVDRNATLIESKDFDFATVDATNMPIIVLKRLEKFYQRKEKNIVLLGVTTIDTKTIRVGEI